MNQRDQGIFNFLQKFCKDNAGNRLNEWNIETFLNRAARLLEGRPEGEIREAGENESKKCINSAEEKKNP